jgi:protocatechuate 3,4-dioxygenase beta subunit
MMNTTEKGRAIFDRRAVLATLGALGASALVGCGGASSDSGTSGGAAASGSGGTAGGNGARGASVTSGNEIPDETAGPYPDTKGMIGNMSTYRSDIADGRPGVPLTLTLVVVDAANACAAIANANVEIWHCDADGVYSEYSSAMNAGSTSATYLRGIQTSDAKGQVTFKTIYPGWYNGRAPHIHIEVYNGTTSKKTTQLGFPESISQAVYGDAALYRHGQSLTSNDNDLVFGTAAGGHNYQIAGVNGDKSNGYLATLVVAIKNFA